MSDQILVCQNRTCRKQGSPQVLKAFQTVNAPNIEITATGCLGHCGSGPMVVILPEEIWYTQVDPQDAVTIVKTLENRQ
ncbi:MAG: (2Fe-2S) ferredoxin domain-containing protein [Microcoleaceae cyanobacterium]